MFEIKLQLKFSKKICYSNSDIFSPILYSGSISRQSFKNFLKFSGAFSNSEFKFFLIILSKVYSFSCALKGYFLKYNTYATTPKAQKSLFKLIFFFSIISGEIYYKVPYKVDCKIDFVPERLKSQIFI